MKRGGAQTGALQRRSWRQKHINSVLSADVGLILK